MLAPSEASFLAISKPIPLEAPVMKTVLFLNILPDFLFINKITIFF
jgi:hypothetical protein